MGMIAGPPIYKESGRTYVADTCGPLVRVWEAGQVRLHALVCGHYPGTKLPRGTQESKPSGSGTPTVGKTGASTGIVSRVSS
jgi:hypothetical protein